MKQNAKQELINNWKRTKAALAEAQDAHMKSEYALYEDAKSDIPEKGTFHYGDIKIVTGYTEKWDQEAINKIYESWGSDLKFPFKGEWKPDGKAISYIRENAAGVYKKLSEALTLTPKKPAFSVVERAECYVESNTSIRALHHRHDVFRSKSRCSME